MGTRLVFSQAAFGLWLLSCLWVSSSGSFAADAPAPGYTWKDCERVDLGGATIPFDRDGKFRPECAPDTVYSWMDAAQVLALKPATGARDAIRFPFLYTWRTPLGSQYYGSHVVRLKLKPGTRFVLVDSHHRDCKPGESGTVHVATKQFVATSTDDLEIIGASEYILCSPDVVESWSAGSSETAEEMKRERAWIESHRPGEYDHFMKLLNPADFSRFLAQEFDQGYSRRLEVQLKASQDGTGLIFYAPGVPTDRRRHFATKRPGYFNPRGEATEAPILEEPRSRCEAVPGGGPGASLERCVNGVAPVLRALPDTKP